MPTDEPKKTRGRSHVTKLINLVLASGAELFRSPQDDLYVTVPNGAYQETFSLTDHTMKEWLARAYFKATKGGVSGGALSDALIALAGSARAQGIERQVYTRVAAIGASVYLDLARGDHQILTITADGWTVAAAPADVRFIRRRGMLPLPIPACDDTPIEVLLARVINLKADGPDMMLLVGWLIGVLRGMKPYPILSIGGEHGSSKSYACRLARRIIDPNEADLSSSPKEARDLLIAATNSHVIGFDNLSFIPDWLSDDLCRLATGIGFRTRALCTDREEVIFNASRPIVLNGIADMIRRGDLMDRSISITLDPITDERRRTEANVDMAFREVQPGILAALANAVSQALREPVTLTRMPRMADFATTVESGAPALNWKPGAFLDAYAERRATAIDILLDGDLVAAALEELRGRHQSDVTKGATWEGTSEELRDQIVALTPEAKRERLPKSGKGLIGALRRVAPGLREKHVDIGLPKGQETSGERRGQRVIRITWEGRPRDDATPDLLEFAAVNTGPNPYAHVGVTGVTDESPF
jgi:putative DNA primase/helicase